MFAIKKKKYAFWQSYLFNNPKIGAVKGELIPMDKDGVLIKGILLARRDNCIVQRELYKDVLFGILTRKTHQEIIDIILSYLVKVYTGKFDHTKFTTIKSINAHYKSDNFYMKIFGDELSRIGKPATPGDRLGYVIVKERFKDELLGYRMRLPETMVENNEEIDYIYYIEHAMMNSIEQLWQIAFKDEISKLEEQYMIWDKYYCCLHVLNRNATCNAKMMELYYMYQGNYNLIYDNMFTYPGLKTASQDAQRANISGRSVIKLRLGASPIKHFIKAIQNTTKDNNLINEYVKNIISPNAYELIRNNLTTTV